jgi:hypothetical protein
MVVPPPQPTATFATKYGVCGVCAAGCILVLVLTRRRAAVPPCRAWAAVYLAEVLFWGGVGALFGAIAYQRPRLTLGGSADSGSNTVNMLMLLGVLASTHGFWLAAFWLSMSTPAASTSPPRLCFAPHPRHHARVNVIVVVGCIIAFGVLVAEPSFTLAIVMACVGALVLMLLLARQSWRRQQWRCGCGGTVTVDNCTPATGEAQLLSPSTSIDAPRVCHSCRAGCATTLAGFIVSLVGYGVSASLESSCHPSHLNGYYSHVCPLPSAFDENALYHVLQMVGYALIAAGAVLLSCDQAATPHDVESAAQVAAA